MCQQSHCNLVLGKQKWNIIHCMHAGSVKKKKQNRLEGTVVLLHHVFLSTPVRYVVGPQPYLFNHLASTMPLVNNHCCKVSLHWAVSLTSLRVCTPGLSVYPVWVCLFVFSICEGLFHKLKALQFIPKQMNSMSTLSLAKGKGAF